MGALDTRVVSATGGDQAISTPETTEVGNFMVLFLAISPARQAVTTTNGWTKWPANAVDIVNSHGFPWGDQPYGMQVWTKTADTAGVTSGPIVTTTVNPNWYPWQLLVLRRVDALEAVAYASYDPPVTSASAPALTGGNLCHFRTFDSNIATQFVGPSGVDSYFREVGYRAGMLTDFTTAAATITDQYGAAHPGTEWITVSLRLHLLPFDAPPCRNLKRGDRLDLGGARNYPPSKMQQTSSRGVGAY